MTFKKKILKKSLALMLAMCTVFSAASTGVSAKSIGGGVGTDVSKNVYTITQKYVDKAGNQLNDSSNTPVADTTTSFQGVGVTHTYIPQVLDKLVYVGYYVAPQGISAMKTGNPSVTSQANGSDAVNGQGAFTVYHVYKLDENGNKIPDEDERYNVNERFVDVDQNVVRNPESKTVTGVYYNSTHPTVTDYTYLGYYYTAVKGGYAHGSLAAPIAGDPTNMLLNSDDGTNTYNVTFVYKSDRVKISINYNANALDALGTMGTDYAYKNVPVKLSTNLFARPGYKFDGWSTNPISAVVYTDAQTVTLDDNTQLYAKWSYDATQYTTITFNKNHADAVGGMPAQTVLKNKSTAINPNQFSRDGYLFDGWSTSSTGTKSFEDNGLINISTPTTLYAVWKLDPNAWISVTFDKNHADATGTMANQSMVKNKSTALNAVAFTRDGYLFTGWAESNAGPVVYTDSQAVSFGTSKTLYAVWAEDPNAYVTITFDLGMSLSGSMDPQKARKGTTVQLSPNKFVHDSEHVFLGWSLTPEGVVAYTDAQTITVTGAMTLYAIWGTPEFYGGIDGKTDAFVGEKVEYKITYGVENKLHSTPYYKAGFWVQLSEHLDKLDNLVITKNGVAIPESSLDYTYNFSTKRLVVNLGNILPGDEYVITFSGNVLPSGQDQKVWTEWDIFGQYQAPVGFMAFAAVSSSPSHSIGGGVSTNVIG